MPVVSFTVLDTVYNPSSGGVAPATWFTTIEANFRSITGRVGCSLTESAAQDVATPGTTTLTLGTVEWNNGMTTGAVANAITVPASYAGKYLIAATVQFSTVPSGANSVIMDILNNGASIHREIAARTSASGGVESIACTIPHILAVGDDLTLSVTMSTNLTDGDTEPSQVRPTLAAVWLSA